MGEEAQSEHKIKILQTFVCMIRITKGPSFLSQSMDHTYVTSPTYTPIDVHSCRICICEVRNVAVRSNSTCVINEGQQVRECSEGPRKYVRLHLYAVMFDISKDSFRVQVSVQPAGKTRNAVLPETSILQAHTRGIHPSWLLRPLCLSAAFKVR